MKKIAKRKKLKEIIEYDTTDVSHRLDRSNPLTLENLGFQLPNKSPTEIVSIRLPRGLLNELRALGSGSDVSYQAIIKLMLIDGLQEWKRKKAA